jgi:transcriptional regulator with XRE-family HTH domain
MDMQFGEQIRTIRKENGLTQEQFAVKLDVTRQAVSNWENERNLPDIEMLIRISRTFNVSLDRLILGEDRENEMNNMTEKLIEDGSETRRARMNLVSTVIGGVLMLLGFMCFLIKALSVEYIDAQGILHENFFLIPVGFLLLFAGFLVILISGIAYLVERHKKK